MKKNLSAGKIIALIFGIFFLIIGVSITVSGIAVYAVSSVYTDSSGYFTTPDFQLTQTNSVAITLSDININFKDTTPQWIQSDLGNIVKIRINLISNATYFVGIAQTSQVIQYLQNVPYSEIQKLDWVNGISYKTQVNQNSNATLASTPPENQTAFTWDASAVGNQGLDWTPKAGSWTIVIMKADGTKGIDVGIKAGAKIPVLGAIATFLIIFGVMFIVLAIVMFIIVAKTNKTKIMTVNQYIPSQPVRVTEYSTQPYVQAPMYGTPSQKAQPQVQDTPQQQVSRPTNEEIYVVAEWGPRLLAYIIDIIVVSIFVDMIRLPIVIGDPTNSLLLYPAGVSINGVVLFIYFILLESNYGTTLGKEIMKLQVITEDGRKPEIKEAGLSALGKAFFLPIDVIVGLIIKDTEHEIPLNQRFMQKVSKTLVIVKPLKQTLPQNLQTYESKT